MSRDDEGWLQRSLKSLLPTHTASHAPEDPGSAATQRQVEAGRVGPEPVAGPGGDGYPVAGTLQARLDGIERGLATLTRAVEAALPGRVAEGQGPPDVAALTEALASLEKQISRAGREQFKASTLAEAQRDQLNAVLEELRAAEVQRKEEVEAIREGLAAAEEQARLDVAQRILPALDGLDEALRSGRRLSAAPPPAEAPPRRSWFRRSAAPTPSDERLRTDLQAWLVGLEFVRERLLGVLAAEGIATIPAQGLPFDPEVHLAVEVSAPGPDTAEGSISAVIRQGYRRGERVLRPAEVAVARAE